MTEGRSGMSRMREYRNTQSVLPASKRVTGRGPYDEH